MVSAREIVGKRIVAFDPGAAIAGSGLLATTMHDPTITLEDGSKLVFLTEEHPNADNYGVWIGRVRPRV